MSSSAIIIKRITALKEILVQLTKLIEGEITDEEYQDLLANTQKISLILKEKKIGSGEYKTAGSLNTPSNFKQIDFFANFETLLQQVGRRFLKQCISAVNAGISMYEEDLIELQNKPKNNLAKIPSELVTVQEKEVSSLIQNLEDHLVRMIITQILMNPEKYSAKYRNISEQRKKVVKESDKYQCQICTEQFPENELEIDHIYPHSLGGSNLPFNLMSLCRECNKNKGARLAYYQSKEGQNKLEMNIRDFVKNLGIILNFGVWLEEMNKFRKIDGRIE